MSHWFVLAWVEAGWGAHDLVFQMALTDNFFHADVHPGNILVGYYPGDPEQWADPISVRSLSVTKFMVILMFGSGMMI